MLTSIETVEAADYADHQIRERRAIRDGRIVTWAMHRSPTGRFPVLIALPSCLARNVIYSDQAGLIVQSREAFREQHRGWFGPRREKRGGRRRTASGGAA
jgi:hypothetical protein